MHPVPSKWYFHLLAPNRLLLATATDNIVLDNYRVLHVKISSSCNAAKGICYYITLAFLCVCFTFSFFSFVRFFACIPLRESCEFPWVINHPPTASHDANNKLPMGSASSSHKLAVCSQQAPSRYSKDPPSPTKVTSPLPPWHDSSKQDVWKCYTREPTKQTKEMISIDCSLHDASVEKAHNSPSIPLTKCNRLTDSGATALCTFSTAKLLSCVYQTHPHMVMMFITY